MEPRHLREAAALAERGVACALATVVKATGSVPGKAGATMLVTVDGTSRGTVGGAGLEERVKKLCVEALQRGEGGVHSFDLANWKPSGLDSVCGGTVEIAIHVVKPVPHVLLVGGGHCAQALAGILDTLGYGYTVLDSRPAYAEGFPRARAAHAGKPADWVRAAEELPFSHVYILGHSHHEDGDALLALCERGFAGTIGVIGSRSKMRAFAERAAARGLTLEGVRNPIGLDIGAQTPAEIAVAVAAEILRDLQRGQGQGTTTTMIEADSP
ncbi:MAG TPA: XdhC/CoxI family protein [Candidatus Thermoplasmatota archaeon]|nr:XdhC/CoxI family protein [Candidatus Thermoplasmatota archaeon]